MGEITIHGYSDDILNVEGDIEWQGYPPREYNLLLDDGTVLHVEYDGEWRIDVEELGDGTSYMKYSAGSEEAESVAGRDYVDVVKLFNDDGFNKAYVVDEVKEVVEDE